MTSARETARPTRRAASRAPARRRPTAAPASGPATGSSHESKSTDAVVALENRDAHDMGLGDRLADRITALCGSVPFLVLNAIFFAAWLILNVTHLGFDPFPFGLLTVIVSLEAIFLATFVLISQNRSAQRADRRDEVDLQVNLVAEREITKLLHLLSEIHEHLGLAHEHDEEVREMRRPTDIAQLADAVEVAEADHD